MRTPTLMLCAALMAAAGVPLALHAQQAPEVVAAAEKKDAPKKKPVPKVVKPPATPAKVLFGAAKTPAPMAARAIGFYAKGCLAGAAALPIDGPAWQAMRLSRNRNWGHPELVGPGREARRRGQGPGRLAGTAGRRPLAAARRADADRPRQPSGRPRRRHLAHAHAEPPAHREGARGFVGHIDAGGTTRCPSIREIWKPTPTCA